MGWIKIDDQMVDHPKIEPLSADAFRWVHRGLSYANRFLTNGILPPAFLDKVPRQHLEELTNVRAGQKNPVWHLADDGHAVIHDYKQYQPTKAAVERERTNNRQRQAKWRDGIGKSKRVSNAVINSAPARPDPTRSVVPPVVPQGGRVSRTRRTATPTAVDPRVLEQGRETRMRRQEMRESGMSDEAIEAVFDREYDARKRRQA